MSKIFQPYKFSNGMIAKNRITLAPLTNCQSHDDGSLSSEEINWLTQKAKGGFSIVETAAAYVHPDGKGFPGQLGIHEWSMKIGLEKLAKKISASDALGIVQLYHGGARSPKTVTGKLPVSPSQSILEDGTPTQELTQKMIEDLKQSFVQAAEIAYDSGFNGIELHAAHAYLIAQFLSPIHNRRQDSYGGSFENRVRLLIEIIHEVRESLKRKSLKKSREKSIEILREKSIDRSREKFGSKVEANGNYSDDQFGHDKLADFLIGVRISPENHGISTLEMLKLTEILYELKIDFLSVSFWDVTKKSIEFPDKDLLDFWTQSKSKETALMVAGKLDSIDLMERTLAKGADLLAVGRLAIANSNLANSWQKDTKYQPLPPPWSREQLELAGVSTPYWNYLSRRFPDLIGKP